MTLEGPETRSYRAETDRKGQGSRNAKRKGVEGGGWSGTRGEAGLE